MHSALPQDLPAMGTTALRSSLLLSKGPRPRATQPAKPERLGAGLAAAGPLTTNLT